MPTLNQNIQFKQLSDDVRNAFQGGMGSKILLSPGTSLFRFSGHSHISPWWSLTSELPDLLLSAKASGQNLFNYVRRTTAVLRKWDADMYNLIIAELTSPVYAFKGGILPQNEASRYMNPKDYENYKKKFTKPVFMGGGNGQLYIKDLSGSQLNIVVPAGAVNVYDNIDEIIDFLVSYHLV